MNCTVYVPDELGKWAKGERINVSRTLREALIKKRELMEIKRASFTEPQRLKLELRDDDGLPYIGCFTGMQLVDDGHVDVYWHMDGRVMVHDRRNLTCRESTDPEKDLRDAGFRDPWSYVTVMRALGIVPEVDIPLTPVSAPKERRSAASKKHLVEVAVVARNTDQRQVKA